MRTGAAAGHAGYFHETAFYGSDGEFLDVVIPFLEGGLAAGEPTVVALAEKNTALVRDAIGAPRGITYLAGADHYARPAVTIKAYREMLTGLVAAGARHIRAVGEVPHPGLGVGWDSWARYEAVINHAYDDFPLWGLCPYDTRITPEDVLAEVARTHPHIATADSHCKNIEFDDPARFLRERPAPAPDPLEASVPSATLTDPTPAHARQVAATIAAAAGLDRDATEGLVLATSEVVTNARMHGRAPVSLCAWVGTGRAVVAVTDEGPGPRNVFAGLVPEVETTAGGLGLWIAHQLCSDVALRWADDGFTVRLSAGTPAVFAIAS